MLSSASSPHRSIAVAQGEELIRRVDAAGAAAARGTEIEIEIMGPNVFAGHHGLPEATASAFSADGWLRSGDMGYLDQEGYLFISDRLKDMIISGGENIYPAEPENLINSIDGVTGVAVIGVPDERWGPVPGDPDPPRRSIGDGRRCARITWTAGSLATRSPSM